MLGQCGAGFPSGKSRLGCSQIGFLPLLHELAVGRYFASLAASGSGWGWTVSSPNLLLAHIFPVPRKMRFDRIALLPGGGGAGSKARLGVYNSNGSGTPNALLVESEEFDITGYALVESEINLTLDKGLHFIAVLTNSGTSQFMETADYITPLGARADEMFVPSARWEKNQTYGPLPNPFGTPNITNYGNGIVAAGLRLAELL